MVEKTKYAVLIDAGSSGSRVYVYQWTANPTEIRKTKVDSVPGYTKKKTEPGISTLAPLIAPVKAVDLDVPVHISEQLPEASAAATAAATLDRVKKYLGPLLDHALNFVPLLEIKKTPLFILATGGMRRIELVQYESYLVLQNAITTYLSTTPFHKPVFDTISGEDEAMYGWVAANFVDGCFEPNHTPHGFMELGGESAQFAVSLNLNGDEREYKGLLRLVTIWGEPYNLYVKTWMGVGNDSAWKRHLEKLRSSDSAMPLDPCVPKGYSYRLSGCDKIVMGDGDFKKCMKEALSLLDCPDPRCRDGSLCIYRCEADRDPGRDEFSSELRRKKEEEGQDELPASEHPESVGCLLNDRRTGHPLLKFDKEKFSGASVYWHATHGIFRRSGDSEKENFQSFWDTVVDYSKMDWETLKAHKPMERETEYKHLRRGFFTAAMVMSTLFLGFGVPMPPQAVEATREFAKERVKFAKIAAENAVDVAQDRSWKAYAALERKLKAAEAAEAAEMEAREKAAAAEKAAAEKEGNQKLAKRPDIKLLKEIFLAVPNTPNRQDLLDALQGTRSADDYHEQCTAKARNARSERRKAADEEKEACDKLVDVKAKHRRIERMKERIEKGAKVDAYLVKVYTDQVSKNRYSSLKDADWTLGMIVLHASNCTPVTKTKEGWVDVAKSTPKAIETEG